MFAQRQGPVVEPQSQLQQLVKPIEQTLLRLEQAVRPQLPGPVIEEKQEARPQIQMRDVRDYVMDFMSLYEQPAQAARPAISSSSSSSMTETSEIGTQTYPKQTRETGTQVQIEQPAQPLVKPAGTEPLVDRVVQGPAQPASSKSASSKEFIIEMEEDEDEPASSYTIPRPSFITAERVTQVREMRDKKKLTRDWLTGLTIKGGIESGYQNWDLYSISKALGLVPIEPKKTKGSKSAFVDYILSNV
jgi:hypothetical protein